MKDYWEKVFNYDTYKKGGQYSASNILQPTLITKLQELHPDLDDVETKDKVAAWVGTSIHERAEDAIESLNDESLQTEVKVIHRSLSGTIDMVEIINGIAHLSDIKTGAEANMKKKMREYEKEGINDWVKQESIYKYLYEKQFGIKVSDIATIHWYCTDSKKYGQAEIVLMSKEDTIVLIKEFYAGMGTTIESEPMCEQCVAWRHRWCGVRTQCHHWGLREQSTEIDEW